MDDVKLMDDVERKRYERQKQLAMLKAQNEMLRNSKEQSMSRYKDDPYMMAKKAEDFDNMIGENIKMAQEYLGANENELNSAQYHEPNEQGIKEYEMRLAKNKTTDEEVHNKTSYGNETETEVSEKRKTRRKSRATSNDNKTNVATVQEVKVNVDTPKVEIDGEKVMEQYITPFASENVTKPGFEKPVERKNENSGERNYKTFDPSSIPDYVQYDMIPLPSKGECYPHKKSRVPVAYLTASDENLIASPNMYRDGKLSDIIVQRKILDKDFKVEDMCKGDVDAILVWLRATGYGSSFPIVATNNETGKQYNTTVDLSKLDYLDFDLKGDENGLFEYKSDNGTVIKYRIPTKKDIENLANKVSDDASNRLNAYLTLIKLEDILKGIDFDYNEDVEEDIEDLKLNIGNDGFDNKSDDDLYAHTITEQMIMYTVSINGNEDREYIRGFVENMRAGEARKYREYVNKHQPGVDFNIKVNIPESDGGGSFDTFLGIDDYIFINV